MSAAASKVELEHPASEIPVEEPVLEEQSDVMDRLRALSPPTSRGPIIAIDLDDVLSQTNPLIAQWHNEQYGTSMTLKDFYYYYYWKNPYWGNLKETFNKVVNFYATNTMFEAIPVPGAREGTQLLRDRGFRLIIVTARSQDARERSWKWVNQHFPHIFESIVCTGQFTEADATNAKHEVVTKMSKAQVCESIGARILIDDSSENAMDLHTSGSRIPVLLFGDYEWNRRTCHKEDTRDEMVYEARLAAEGEFWKTDLFEVPEGASITRVKDWGETIRWIDSHLKSSKVNNVATS